MITIPHLPLLENRHAQYVAKFAALPDGNWAFHRNDWEEGWLIPASEHAALIAQHRAILDRVGRLLRHWLWIAVVLIVALVIATEGQVNNWWGGAIAAGPLPWVLWELRRADRLPLIQARMAVAPPRGLRAGARTRMAALPASVPLAMVFVGGLLLFRLWQEHELGSDYASLAIGLGIMAFGSAILWLRRG